MAGPDGPAGRPAEEVLHSAAPGRLCCEQRAAVHDAGLCGAARGCGGPQAAGNGEHACSVPPHACMVLPGSTAALHGCTACKCWLGFEACAAPLLARAGRAFRHALLRGFWASILGIQPPWGLERR